MLPGRYPLDGIGVFFFFEVLYVAPHFLEGIDFVRSGLRMKKEGLIVPRVQRYQIQLGFAIQLAVFKNQITGSKSQISLYLLLHSGGFYMNIA